MQHIPNTFYENEIVSLPKPVKDGYEFVGWYELSDYSGSIIEELEADTKTDIVLYAKWKHISGIESEKEDLTNTAPSISQEGTVTDPAKTENVETGDSSLTGVWMFCGCIAAIGIMVGLFKIKKHNL